MKTRGRCSISQTEPLPDAVMPAYSRLAAFCLRSLYLMMMTSYGIRLAWRAHHRLFKSSASPYTGQAGIMII